MVGGLLPPAVVVVPAATPGASFAGGLGFASASPPVLVAAGAAVEVAGSSAFVAASVVVAPDAIASEVAGPADGPVLLAPDAGPAVVVMTEAVLLTTVVPGDR